MKGLKAESSSPLYHQMMQRIIADIEQGADLIKKEIIKLADMFNISMG